MKRRSFLAALSTLPLVSCLGESVNFRFKVIAKVLVDGQPMERSTVMEIDYARVTHSLTGLGGAATLYGEALIFDMGSRGTFYIIPCERATDGELTQIYGFGILNTFGIKGSIGGLDSSRLDVLRKTEGRRPFNYFGHLPAFIAFGDERNPRTIYELNPHRLNDRLPGVQFVGLDIEVTGEPITKALISRLPWLAQSGMIFEREPPGSLLASVDAPIGFVMQQRYFFGDGTR